MKKSLLLITSGLVLVSGTGCNSNSGNAPKSVTVTSPNANVEITDQGVSQIGMYWVHIKCNTENMYFRKSMYVTDYEVRIGNNDPYYAYPNKRISLNEVEFLFNTRSVGNQDLSIDCTLQNANRTFDKAEFTGAFKNNPPLEFIPFTISVYEKEKTFQVKKLKDIDCLSISITCSEMLYYYGNIDDISKSAWDSLPKGETMDRTFKWYSDNEDFETHSIGFYGNPN